MKLLKTLTMGALLAASIGIASAAPTTVIHISGSTAFRAGVQQAILDYLTTESGGNAPTYAWKGNASVLKASASCFLSNDGTIGVETYWSGSVAGVIDLVCQNQLVNKFPDVNNNTLNNAVATTLNTEASAPVDFAWTDATFGSAAATVSGANIATGSTTTGTATTGAQLSALITGAGLKEAGTAGQTTSGQGIVPFAWFAGATSISGGTPFTNFTTEYARAMITSGTIPLSFATGNSADDTKFIYNVQRAEDSGTRENSLLNAFFPVGNAPKSYQLAFSNNQTVLTDPNFPSGLNTGGVTVANGPAVVTSASLWAGNLEMNTNTNISWSGTGHYGYIGGGDVANVLSATNPANLNIPAGPKGPLGVANTGEFFVGVLGISDGGTVLTNGGTILNWNGVPYTAANLQNGLYTFWGYEHAYLLPTVSADLKNVANGIANTVYNGDATTNGGGVLINSAVLVKKTGDGGAISKNY